MCKVARFYGWPNHEIESLDVDSYDMYLRGMGVIEAQETLLAAEISAYPYGKQQTRQKFYRDVRKLVIIQDDAPPVKLDEFAQHLKGIFNG